MSEEWRCIEDPPTHPYVNMAVDEVLMETVGDGDSPPTVRFYAWHPPAVSLGRFQSPDDTLDFGACREQSILWVTRPTGGRAVLHHDEVTYSICVPASHPVAEGGVLATYEAVARGLAGGLELLGIQAQVVRPLKGDRTRGPRSSACFDAASSWEICVNGRKLVGSAQVRRRGAVLQHGSLPLRFDPEPLISLLKLPSDEARQRIARRMRHAGVGIHEISGADVTADSVRSSLRRGLESALGASLLTGGLSKREHERVHQLLRERPRHSSERAPSVRE